MNMKIKIEGLKPVVFNKILFAFALVLMGLSGFAGQIVCLRELLIVFSGNELSIGIVLANWLVLEAIGAYLGKLVDKIEKKLDFFVWTQVLFCVFFLVSIYLTRIIKNILGVLPGESLNLWQITWTSAFLLSGVSIFHGSLFTIGCRIYSGFDKSSDKDTKEHGTSIGRVYLFETLGSILCGIILTFFLIGRLTSFEIVSGIVFLNTLMCLILLYFKSVLMGHQGNYIGRKFSLNFLSITCIIAFILSVFLVFGGDKKLHETSIKHQWKDQNVLFYANSVYGNVTVIKAAEQYSFLSNGVPVIIAPYPDSVFSEETVHLSMLAHSKVEDVLVLSGGAGGLLNEILKYKIKKIDYAEMDPLIIKTVSSFPTQMTESELKNPRVNVHRTDGRFFLKQTDSGYDMIFVGLNNPSDLQINRLFTKEFYETVRKKLKSEGIFVVTLPGSLSYLDKSLTELNDTVIDTLKSVFQNVRVIPGDFNIIWASDLTKISDINADTIIKNYLSIKPQTNVISVPHIKYKLEKRWAEWFDSMMEKEKEHTRINTDFHPKAVFHSLSYWSSMFSPEMLKFLNLSSKLKLKHIVLFAVLILLIFLFFQRMSTKVRKFSIPCAIGFTGFAGMLYDLILIFAFQVSYGYVYQWIGILITSFMFGVALASHMMTQKLHEIKNKIRVFLWTEGFHIIYSILLLVLFVFPELFKGIAETGGGFLKGIFLLLCFIGGFLTGFQFPLAGEIHLENLSRTSDGWTGERNITSTAGTLYGIDLLGGWVSGICGGIVFLPVLGLAKTCAIIVIFKLISFIIVFKGCRGSIH